MNMNDCTEQNNKPIDIDSLVEGNSDLLNLCSSCSHC